MYRVILTALIAFTATLLPSLVFAQAEAVITPPFNLTDSISITQSGEQVFYVLGANVGNDPTVTVKNEAGDDVYSFLAYAEGYRGGVQVATCDLSGDNVPEIITGTRSGGGPHVRIFSLSGELVHAGFFAYNEAFRGGVNIACADTNNDGLQEIITAPGPGGSPHIRIFTNKGALMDELIIGSHTEDTGAIVRAGNLDNDPAQELVVVKTTATDGSVYILENDTRLKQTHTFKVGTTSAIMPSIAPSNEEGSENIVALPRNDELNRIDYFSKDGAIVRSVPLESNILGTVSLIPHPNGTTLLSHNPENRGDALKQLIVVDISEQRLTAYEGEKMVATFLISSGTYQFPTPLGTTEVTAKLPVHRYTWSYGPNNPNNYDLPGVQWNLRFRKNYYLHSATWHNNFGRRMSHGCINLRVSDAKWLYDWANIGATVSIVP